LDLRSVRALVKLTDGTGLAELEVRRGGRHVRIRWLAPCAAAPVCEPAPAPPSVSRGAATSSHVLASPAVGVFHGASGAHPAGVLEVGRRVVRGQTLGVVESMRLQCEVRTERTGIIEQVLVADGAPVEFGQPLLVIGA
jgi:acetyl-CoA carboxylase biotin carboxyl carrier protein